MVFPHFGSKAKKSNWAIVADVYLGNFCQIVIVPQQVEDYYREDISTKLNGSAYCLTAAH